MKIPIEVTARHIHITREHVQILFGPTYHLTKLKEISIEGQFACKETLCLKTSRGVLDKVRIVGPERDYTQVELCATDAYLLGISVPVRVSSDIANTPGIRLIGPLGELKLDKGVILPRRHLHASPKNAKILAIKDGQEVSVEVENGYKSLIFKNVLTRVHESFNISMHVDTDEGNAAGINRIGFGRIVI